MTATTHSEGKHLGPAQYVMVWAALMVPTGLTLAVWKNDMSYAARVVVALATATVKAAFVVLYFMHLRYDRPFNAVILITSLALVMLFIGIALTDTCHYLPEMIPGYAPGITNAPK